MDESTFGINNHNLLLKSVRKNNNYKVIHGLENNKICLIFCSSNAIYFPNTQETFIKRILCEDKYEWTTVSSYLCSRVEKIIMIRDVYKNWYVTGISEEVDTIDKLLILLGKECCGYDIMTFGNSAGGYLATIIGAKLGARAVFNWGGQWNLYQYQDVIKRYYFLDKYKDEDIYNQYYNIVSLVQNKKVNVFYFYSGLCIADVEQEKWIQDINNVYAFALDSDTHGTGLSMEAYVNLPFCDLEKVKEYSIGHKGTLLNIAALSHNIMKMVKSDIRYIIPPQINAKEKARLYRNLLVQWICKEIDIKKQIELMGYKQVAIWGKGDICDLLLGKLDNAITVKYIIESHPIYGTMYHGIPLIGLEELPFDIEAVIVIPYYDLEKITNEIRLKNTQVSVIGLNQIIK